MATGRNSPEPLSKGSEEIFDFCCTPCSHDGDIVEAVNQCLDCNEYMCTKCTSVHNKLGATSGHKVLDQKDMRKTQGSSPKKPSPPSQKCQAHGGERITTYCGGHDVVCCNTGVAVDHKNCDDIQYIVDAAAGIKSRDQIQTTKSSIGATLKETEIAKNSCQTDLTNLGKEKAAGIEQVHDFTERQIHRLRELETATIEEINSKYKGRSARIDRDVASLDGVTSTMERDLKKLDHSHDNQEADIFVDVKISQCHEAKGRKLLQQLSKSQTPSLKILLKENIESDLKDLGSLGSFAEDNHVYNAKSVGDYNIKVKQDTRTCDTTGSCQLPDGTVMLTDLYNRRLKRIDASYHVMDHCETPRGPWGVTCTAPDEVAITMTNVRKVQFASVRESITLTRSFSTNARCRGICYSGGKLYVTCGDQSVQGGIEGTGHVAVFSLTGVPIRKIQTDPSGQQIFSCLMHTCTSFDDNTIYIADSDGGVKLLDNTGILIGTITNSSLKDAYGVCSLDNGHILVCCAVSNNVVQFDGNGSKVAELLNATDDIRTPMSLCYDSINSRLIVTMKDTDNIHVFDLK